MAEFGVGLRRRQFLALAGAVAGAASVNVGEAKSSRGAPIVLVHGAWHSSFCWCEVTDRLRGLGRQVLALDLPGHGINARYPRSYFAPGQAGFEEEVSAVAGVTLDAAADAVVAALKQVQSAPKPVLVGHSLGGTVITRAAELAPELIGHLVYLSAYLPSKIPSPAALYDLPEAGTIPKLPIVIGDAGKIGAVRLNPRGDVEYLRKLHQVFYQDVEFEEFLPFVGTLSPDLPLPLWTGETGATVGRWGSLSRTYIHCTRDGAIAPALQLRMIADADGMTPGNRCDVVRWDSSHSPFVSRPGELAQLLARL